MSLFMDLVCSLQMQMQIRMIWSIEDTNIWILPVNVLT